MFLARLGLAIGVNKFDSGQPGWPDYINKYNPNPTPTQLLIGVNTVTRTWPDCKLGYPTRTWLTRLFPLKKKLRPKKKKDRLRLKKKMKLKQNLGSSLSSSWWPNRNPCQNDHKTQIQACLVSVVHFRLPLPVKKSLERQRSMTFPCLGRSV